MLVSSGKGDSLPLELTLIRPCKTRKIKCGEEKPKCQNCERQGETCDYSIRLNWEGRTKRKSNDFISEPAFNIITPSTPKAGVFARTRSDPTLPEIKRTSYYNDGGDQKRKSASIGDAYSLAGASRNQYKHEEEHNVASYLSPPNNTAMVDLKFPSDGSMSALSDGMPIMPSTIDIGYNGALGGQRASNFRDHISSAQLSRIREQTSISYPSPADSSTESPPLSGPTIYNHPGHHHSSNPQMPPPLQSPSSSSLYGGVYRKSQDEISETGDNTLKRLRMSPSLEAPDNSQRNHSTPYCNHSGTGPVKCNPYHSPQSTSFRSYSPSSGYGAVVLTPAASSVTSDDTHARAFIKPPSQARQESPDRRLSVSSLLSGPPGGEEPLTESGGESAFPTTPHNQSHNSAQLVNYGVDRGFPDLDLPNNNDTIVLNGFSPSLSNASYAHLGTQDTTDEQSFNEFGFGLYVVDFAHDLGGYYAKPVTVAIPRSLGTLPTTLQENPMNLLYFHHFLNHTASILVPHDCSENPFKNILPQSM